MTETTAQLTGNMAHIMALRAATGYTPGDDDLADMDLIRYLYHLPDQVWEDTPNGTETIAYLLEFRTKQWSTIQQALRDMREAIAIPYGYASREPETSRLRSCIERDMGELLQLSYYMRNHPEAFAKEYELERKRSWDALRVEILRGKEHIGGNIIKVSYDLDTILLDCGALLPELGEPVPDDFDMSKVRSANAVFLSHHHGDHSGRISELWTGTKLYASKETFDFMNHLDVFLDRPARLGGREAHVLQSGCPVTVGEIKVTPIAAEHSAEGAMMFLVEAGGKRLLYTGDFKRMPDFDFGEIDLLITEGTMLTRDGQKYADEAAVEVALRRVMENTKGRVFVLQSTANLPRIQSVMAAKGERPVMQDIFMKYILEATGHKELAAKYGFVWNPFGEQFKTAYSRIAQDYFDKGQASSSYSMLECELQKAVVFIRASMADLLKMRIAGGMDISQDMLIYSQWSGYKKEQRTAELLRLFRPEQVIDIHTSGHADRKHIEELIRQVKPKRIACIHSENASEIAAVAGDAMVDEKSTIEL